ncbi:MAG TPA: NAD(P)H:quinone oxidoreductase [Chthonomonadales bacterium]|nr:NAD(P)H:quinone oxidoreductase [Chthonomonadales bacterium]
MQPKVLVVFYSRTGNVATLADAIAAGAAGAGADVRTVRIDDLAPATVIEANSAWKASRDAQRAKYEEARTEDLEWADAVVFGTPTRFGNMAAELKLYLDKTSALWMQGKLANKVASMFTSAATPHGGHETTLLTMLIPLLHHGMVIVTPGYTDPGVFSAGTPYGASSVVGGGADQPPTEGDLGVAEAQGRRVAEIAAQLLRGRAA